MLKYNARIIARFHLARTIMAIIIPVLLIDDYLNPIQTSTLYWVVYRGTQWLFDCIIWIVWIVWYRCCCSNCCSGATNVNQNWTRFTHAIQRNCYATSSEDYRGVYKLKKHLTGFLIWNYSGPLVPADIPSKKTFAFGAPYGELIRYHYPAFQTAVRLPFVICPQSLYHFQS